MNRRVKALTVISLIVFCFAPTGYASAKTNEYSQALVDELLKKITTYQQGQSRENLIKLEEIVRRSHNSSQFLAQLQEQFSKFLRSNATLPAKQFICTQLSIIGTEQSVPALASMLTKPETSDMARYALERIPGAAADKTLRDALDKTDGKTKTGIINSLGKRRDKKAVAPLSKLLTDTDKQISQAAAAALGKIASPSAAEELGKALKTASADSRPALADAYLMCADQLAATGDKKAAVDIYKKLYYKGPEPTPIKSAALKGMVAAASPQDAVKLIVEVLTSDSSDPAMKPVAISLVRKLPGTKATKTIAAELPKLSPSAQEQLLTALADRRDPAALPAVTNAVKSEYQNVQIAALKALASLGDSSTAILLAETAASSLGNKRYFARESLCSLNAPGVDQKIVDQISDAEPKLKVELIRAIGCRNITDAVQNLLETVKHSDRNVRLESIKVLRNLAKPQHLPILVDALINSKDGTELREAEKTVASVARKSHDKDKAAEVVLKALDSAKEINFRCALLRTLVDIGDDKSLSVLRKSLKDDNIQIRTAAVRSLSEWPNAAPIADLLEIVQNFSNRIQRALALRGYVRMIALDGSRPVEETAKMFSRAMSLAHNNDERKMILAAMMEVKSTEVLQLAAAYIDNKDLNREAAAAVVKIAESTLKSDPNETKAALQKVLDTASTDPLREQAQQLINQIK